MDVVFKIGDRVQLLDGRFGLVTNVIYSNRKKWRAFVTGAEINEWVPFAQLVPPIEDVPEPVKTAEDAGCSKKAFLTKKEARARVAVIITKESRRPTRDKVPVRVYKCEKCGLYHLTSDPLPIKFKN